MTNNVKRLQAIRLMNLLKDVPYGSQVEVNAVGNLALRDQYNNYIGYIDFQTGTVELFEDDF